MKRAIVSPTLAFSFFCWRDGKIMGVRGRRERGTSNVEHRTSKGEELSWVVAGRRGNVRIGGRREEKFVLEGHNYGEHRPA